MGGQRKGSTAPPLPGAAPVVDRKAANQLNLAVLKRLDPETEEVLTTAGHVALYEFLTDKKEWSRMDIEGSLFLLKRRSHPRFQFIVLNKKSQNNYVEPLVGGFSFEEQNEKYLLYRNVEDEVLAIWFYQTEECEMVAALLQKISSAYASERPDAEGQSAAASRSGQNRGPEGEAGFWDHRGPENTAREMQSAGAEFSGAAVPSAGSQNGSDRGAAALFSNMKLGLGTPGGSQRSASHTSAPTASGTGGGVGYAARSDQPPAKPALLAPSFFLQNAQSPASHHQSSASGRPSLSTPPPPHSASGLLEPPRSAFSTAPQKPASAAKDDERKASAANLRSLLARAASNSTSGAGAPPSPMPILGKPLAAGGGSSPPSASARGQVRDAFQRLLQRDEFVDMLAAEFQAVGLLP